MEPNQASNPSFLAIDVENIDNNLKIFSCKIPNITKGTDYIKNYVTNLRNSLENSISEKDISNKDISEKDYIIAAVKLDPTILNYMKNQYTEILGNNNFNLDSYNFDIDDKSGRDNIAKLTLYVISELLDKENNQSAINNNQENKSDINQIFDSFCENVKVKQDRDSPLRSGIRNICKYGPISAIAFLAAPKIAVAGLCYYGALGAIEASKYLCPSYFNKIKEKFNEFDENNNIEKIAKMPHKLFSRSAELLNSSICKMSSYVNDKIEKCDDQNKYLNIVKNTSKTLSGFFNKVNNYLDPKPIKFFPQSKENDIKINYTKGNDKKIDNQNFNFNQSIPSKQITNQNFFIENLNNVSQNIK